MPRLALVLLPFLLGSCLLVHEERAPDATRRVFALAGDTRPFSEAVLTGDTLWLAGSLGLDPATSLPPADVREEVRLLLDSIEKKLALAGMDMSDLVSVQVFCPDVGLYGDFNDVYRTYFDGEFPARSFIGSGPLLFGCRFELNGVAVRR